MNIYLTLVAIGPSQLLALITLILFLWLIPKLIKGVSRIESWISKRFAKRFLVNPDKFNESYRTHNKLWWVSFLIAPIVAITILIITNTIVFIFSDRSQEEIPLWVALISNFLVKGVGVGSIIIGIILHFKSGGNRKVKYNYLITGLTIYLGAFFSILIPLFFDIQPFDDFHKKSINSFSKSEKAVIIWIIIIYLSYILIVPIIVSLLVGPPNKKNKTSHQLSIKRRLYYKVQRLGYFVALSSICGWTHLLLIPYLILRYNLGEYMSHAPILYLRSFHYVEGPTAFGKIVARVASRYGVLIALVHKTQHSLKLHEKTRLTERAELINVPDKKWQNWIEEQIRRASFIIIDYSVNTEGLSWELKRATSLVDSSNILLIHQKGDSVSAPRNLWKLEYEIGKKGERQARKKLRKHLHKILLAN